MDIDTWQGSIGIRGTRFHLSVTETEDSLVTFVQIYSGIVDVTERRTGAIHTLSDQGLISVTLTGPLPSFDTISPKMLHGINPILSLQGYTDAAFTVQRSDNLNSWEDWMTLESFDLPVDLEVTNAGGARFFRLKRTTLAQ